MRPARNKTPLTFDKRIAERGTCGRRWLNKQVDNDEQDHPTHTCSRFKRHRAYHKCNCGKIAKGAGQ